MTTAEIRTKYLEFFKAKGHKVFASDTLVPDDPTVLFTSAGMNQFKSYFLGQKKDVKRATSCQKCFRTGDLDNVGKTPHHHTFFEMLGNFSFGDYFKKEAISYAWEFLTQILKIEKKDLWISVYKDDDEAYLIWEKEIKVPAEKIVRLGEDSNFWPANAPSLGPNGPCGPCSEIFFDQGKDVGCKRKDCSPACDCSRFVEVWNLVFTQFNRVAENKLEPLPQKNIDTGMGLERMAAVLQKKVSNFEIDIFEPVVTKIKEILKLKSLDDKTKSLVYAIADHARAATFSISDGVYPSNEERGYVVRKIIRKASEAGIALGAKEIFLYRLVEVFSQTLGEIYPDIKVKSKVICEVMMSEEDKFIHAFSEGKMRLDELIKQAKAAAKKDFDPQEAFKLYDTYGFPIESTMSTITLAGLNLDRLAVSNLIEKQQEQSRKASMFGEDIFNKDELVVKSVSKFLGYEAVMLEAKISQIFKAGNPVDELTESEKGLVVLDKTPFYPEGGGQLSDRGIIKTDAAEFKVIEVFKAQEAIVHRGIVVNGKLTKIKAMARVDVNRRNALQRAHTVTHLLQAALRRVLGPHVVQQGSLVDEDRLRFDFSHFKALTSDEINRVEDEVNNLINLSLTVSKKNCSLAEAKKRGALAFFKDKYKDTVRMVTVETASIELCGGTHLNNTAEAGMFAIAAESSIASGTRRIEALTGAKAYQHYRKLKDTLEDASGILKCDPLVTPNAIEKLKQDIKSDKDRLGHLEKEALTVKSQEVIKLKKEVNGVNFIAYQARISQVSNLLYLADLLKSKTPSLFLFMTASLEDRQVFVCLASDDLVKKGIDTKGFIDSFKAELGLKGGGRGNLIQGVITAKQDELLEKVEACFRKYSAK